ncbi:hypothetical protein T492DRAFT_870285 [Pavlovales sp. CCMP2436]|nr:hypothetical protein T492DRAFT_870285 [Pavlovales sp. CCMP2436]
MPPLSTGQLFHTPAEQSLGRRLPEPSGLRERPRSLRAMARNASTPAASELEAEALSPAGAAADVDVLRQIQRAQARLSDQLAVLHAAMPRERERLYLLPVATRSRAEAQLARSVQLEAQIPFCDEFVAALLALQRRCRQTRHEIDNGSWLTARRELHVLTAATDELAGTVGRTCAGAGSEELLALMMAQLRRLGHRVHGLMLRANAALPSGAGTGATNSANYGAEQANIMDWGERGPSWLFVGADLPSL